MKYKTETTYWVICEYCGMKYQYIIPKKELAEENMKTHEEKCQCNPKNDPCPKCKGTGTNLLTYGEWHIKYNKADPEEYSTKISPMMEEKCPKCKGTGKGHKTLEREKQERIRENQNRWW